MRTKLLSMLLLAWVGGSHILAQNLPTGMPEAKPKIERLPDGSAKKSAEFSQSLGAETQPNQSDGNWQAVLENSKQHGANDAPKPDPFREVKLEKYRQKVQGQANFPSNEECADPAPDRAGLPYVATNFQGNSYNGCPPDNTLAISNGGYIVSCVNSNLYIYNQSGSLLSSTTLYDFFSPLGIPDALCDPKIIYDALADRYILYTQVCNGQPSSKQVLLAFSKSSNPLNGWWVYGITGDPLGDGSWLDYPKIGVSNNEFYLTGNLYFASGGYNQSVFYQIRKQNGYAGQNLNWQYWYDMDGKPFTLLPLSQGHSKTYGPGTYLVASLPGGGNHIQFYDLTDDMSASNEQLNFYKVNVPAYDVPPAAGQFNSWYALDGGDCRTMDGFYLNGTAHFTFTVDNDNWASISYNRLKITDLSIQQALATFPGEKDYAYASVASFSRNVNDQSAVVVFLASGNNYYPEIRMKYYDNAMNTTASTLIKEGDGSIGSSCYDPNRNYCRWGDYSGLARKHNGTANILWTSGCYGGWWGSWETWIAEIRDSGTPIATDEAEQKPASMHTVPNPVGRGERFTVHIFAEKNTPVVFKINAVDGSATHHELYRGHLLAGENQFSIQTAQLPSGIFWLTAQHAETHQILAHEKIVIVRT